MSFVSARVARAMFTKTSWQSCDRCGFNSKDLILANNEFEWDWAAKEVRNPVLGRQKELGRFQPTHLFFQTVNAAKAYCGSFAKVPESATGIVQCQSAQ